MLIENVLDPDESLICSWRNLHATEKRIVRLETGKIGYQLNEVFYEKISSVTTLTARRKSMIVLGLLVALMGYFLFPDGTIESVFILTGLISVAGAIFGIGRSRRLQIFGQDFTTPDQTLWEFEDFDTPQMRNLCLTIGFMVSKSGGTVLADETILNKINAPDIP